MAGKAIGAEAETGNGKVETGFAGESGCLEDGNKKESVKLKLSS
ncbi:MAG: hypothetical protein ACQPRI_06295 [Solitalea-like symbiont of Tyrophagus putrescentiae]